MSVLRKLILCAGFVVLIPSLWAAPGDGSMTIVPGTYITGDSGNASTFTLTGGTAWAATGGLLTIFFPLGFDLPTSTNFFVRPGQESFLLSGNSSSVTFSGLTVTAQLKNLTSATSLDFLYGWVAGGHTVTAITPTAEFQVYTHPESITLGVGVEISPRPAVAVHTPTVTPTITPTSTVTSTPSNTPDYTATDTPTISPTHTYSPTISPTFTITQTHTFSPTSTLTPIGSVEPGELYAYPNPWDLRQGRGHVTLRYPPAPGQAIEITIFNIAAEPVRRLSSSDIIATLGVADWDGRDDHGRNVPGGIYLARVKIGSTVLTAKFAVYN